MEKWHLDDIKVHPAVECSSWEGGSLLSRLSFFDKFCVTREEFEADPKKALDSRYEMGSETPDE